MIQTVQRTGTIPLTYSRGTVLSAEESVGTVYCPQIYRSNGTITVPLISTLHGLSADL